MGPNLPGVGTIRDEIRQTKPFESAAQEAVVTLLGTADRVRTALSRVTGAHDVTLQQYNVLRILRGARPERLACGTIGERMVAHDPDLTRLLDRLQAAGLVDKSRDERDRRAMLVSITRKGLDVVERASRAVEERLQGALGGLGARKLEALADLLELVRGAEA